MKRLETGRFPWPRTEAEARREIGAEELRLLLMGIDFWNRHEELTHREIIHTLSACAWMMFLPMATRSSRNDGGCICPYHSCRCLISGIARRPPSPLVADQRADSSVNRAELRSRQVPVGVDRTVVPRKPAAGGHGVGH